jgi:hypothetical protein
MRKSSMPSVQLKDLSMLKRISRGKIILVAFMCSRLLSIERGLECSYKNVGLFM